MPKFTLEIDTSIAAFGDPTDPTHYRGDRAEEIAACLADAAAWVARRPLENSGTIVNRAGQPVGEWRIADGEG